MEVEEEAGFVADAEQEAGPGFPAVRFESGPDGAPGLPALGPEEAPGLPALGPERGPGLPELGPERGPGLPVFGSGLEEAIEPEGWGLPLRKRMGRYEVQRFLFQQVY